MTAATQGWWCRTLQWFCDNGPGTVPLDRAVPEITDLGILLFSVTVVILSVIIVHNSPRR